MQHTAKAITVIAGLILVVGVLAVMSQSVLQRSTEGAGASVDIPALEEGDVIFSEQEYLEMTSLLDAYYGVNDLARKNQIVGELKDKFLEAGNRRSN